MDRFELTKDMIERLETIIGWHGRDNRVIDDILLALGLEMVDGHLTDEW